VIRTLAILLLILALGTAATAATPAEMDAIEAELRVKRGDPTYTLPRAGGSHMSELSMREMYGLVPSTRDVTATTGTLMRPPGNIGAWSPRAERLVSPEGAEALSSAVLQLTSNPSVAIMVAADGGSSTTVPIVNPTPVPTPYPVGDETVTTHGLVWVVQPTGEQSSAMHAIFAGRGGFRFGTGAPVIIQINAGDGSHEGRQYLILYPPVDSYIRVIRPEERFKPPGYKMPGWWRYE
jgi:hypothetical protein